MYICYIYNVYMCFIYIYIYIYIYIKNYNGHHRNTKDHKRLL